MPFDDRLRQRLLDLVDAHAAGRPERAAEAALFRRFIHAHPTCCERSLAVGHLTGSAWVVDAAGRRALLVHHRKLDRWLQPGGHADGDADLARVALREAEEETGLPGLVLDPLLFDLDRHWIPARGPEPGHWHYDLRFVVRATAGEDFIVSAESHALAWVAIDAIAADVRHDGSLRRMAAAWLARHTPV